MMFNIFVQLLPVIWVFLARYGLELFLSFYRTSQTGRHFHSYFPLLVNLLLRVFVIDSQE